ncbi:MAG: hypothetical protein KJ737_17400 [Proteobacteria bacterium]|nr:hypothetical protein [Pseudomonadota bacterium]
MKKIYVKMIMVLAGLMITGNIYANDTVQIHGFMSQGYLKSDGNNYLAESKDGSFQFNEMGLNFKMQATDKLQIGMQFFARDMGPIGNDEIVLDWAFADYKFKDYLGLRAGKIKSPIGFYHETRDVDILRTSILLPSAVYDENLRDSANAIHGVGIYGDVTTDFLGNFTYQALVGTQNISTDGGTAKYISQTLFDIQHVGLDSILAYSLQWVDPSSHLRIGGTCFFTEIEADGVTQNKKKWDGISGGLFEVPEGTAMDNRTRNIEEYIGSIEFTWNDLLVAYEYKVLKTTGIFNIYFPEFTITSLAPLDILGYYGLVSYRFLPFFEAGIYYGEFFVDANDRDGSKREVDYLSWQKDFAVSLKFDINDNWIIKLETHYFDGAANLNLELNPGTNAKYWWLYAAKVSYVF